ncbi:hypothetical protein PY365_20275 [Roseiarcaceae bacterium H3SJ34-1]|uniref:hypothetical protein n=1 Tax=Terripilifer ovatus TaxID=3032367 RepID=UPI003AB91ED7|nr:hypothetical protein [Roseiarcaceae bacterium H3SJ34-1]
MRLGIAVAIGLISTSALGQAPVVRIVGPGAVRCARFSEDIARDPRQEREYFAWAQGVMSGLMLRAPTPAEGNLDLLPPGFGVAAQMDFLKDDCEHTTDQSFTDATLALYRELKRRKGDL